MFEQSKAAARRYRDGAFHSRYFAGHGIDITIEKDPLVRMAHVFPLMHSCLTWDALKQDAQEMSEVKTATYDFVHASHTLVFMGNARKAISEWCRILKPGGYLVLTVPDDQLCGPRGWLSIPDRRQEWRFSLDLTDEGSEHIVRILDLVKEFEDRLILERLCRVSEFFNETLPPDLDQSRLPNTECAIEIVWHKRGSQEAFAPEPCIHSSLIQAALGVWVRPGIPNNAEEVGEHYQMDAVAILNQDQHHYVNLRQRLEELDPELMAGRQTCYAIGGGHPKFEAMFTVKTITVLDQFADSYRVLHEAFTARYPLRCAVGYQTDRLDPATTFIPEDATTTFIHFLEHQTPEEIDAWFKAASREVIVYGPSIEAARTEEWLHYAPKDHITFLTLEAMKGALERAGYTVVSSFRHDEDYYLRAQK